MDNSVVIENLGRLATKAELEAAKATTPSERSYLNSLADRYREAQYVELRKAYGREEAA